MIGLTAAMFCMACYIYRELWLSTERQLKLAKMTYKDEEWARKMRKKAHKLMDEKPRTHTVHLVGGPFDGEDRVITFEPCHILTLPICREYGIDEFHNEDLMLDPWKHRQMTVDYERDGWKETSEGTKLVYRHR